MTGVSFEVVDSKRQTALLNKYPPKPEDAEYYPIVRSIIESPDECSGAWFMFFAQANLHEAGKGFISSNILLENFASIGCNQAHPFSRGSSHISSADMDAKPDIDPNYFSHPADLEIMARHAQAFEMLRQTKELAPFFKPDGNAIMWIPSRLRTSKVLRSMCLILQQPHIILVALLQWYRGRREG